MIVEGTLLFNEQTGNFCICDIENEIYLSKLDFGTEFEAKINDEWIKTSLQISNNEEGEFIFKLKNTNIQGNLAGTTVRAEKQD